MREAVFTRARDYFGADRRVRACWLWGPMAHYILGPLQELSMGIVVRSEDYEVYVDELDQHVAAVMPVVVSWHHNWGADPCQVHHVQAVFEGGLYFELAVHSADDFGPQPGPIEQVFNRDVEISIIPPSPDVKRFEQTAVRFWMGLLLAINQVVRDDVWEALDFIQTRRNLLVACWKLGHGAPSPERLSLYDDPAPPADLQERLRSTVPGSPDPVDLARSIQAMALLFDDLMPGLADNIEAHYPAELAGTVREALIDELGNLLNIEDS